MIWQGCRDAGLHGQIAVHAGVRVHPEHRVGETPQLGHLLSEKGGFATLPAVREDHDDGAAGQAASPPAVQKCAQCLTEPGAAGPVGHRPARGGQRQLRIADPQRA